MVNPAFHNEFYPYPSAVRATKEATDLVGFEKLMWGSDYPRTMTAITYKMSLDFVEKTTEISEKTKGFSRAGMRGNSMASVIWMCRIG